MPTYEYRCRECGHFFESFQNITDSPLTDCPQCGMPTLQRLIGGGGGLLFKGTGFYLTDYKKNSGPKKERSATEGRASKDGTAKKETASS
ncbi:MAG: zinc ribbon domain-containing protein [Bacteroidota bacterium]|nr:zinc ribbon domain-containing protein [Bacteroidota bacterium]